MTGACLPRMAFTESRSLPCTDCVASCLAWEPRRLCRSRPCDSKAASSASSRSGSAACCACEALRPSASRACLSWASRRPRSSRACRSSASPSDRSSWPRRSANARCGPLSASRSLACLSCLSAESPASCSRNFTRSPREACACSDSAYLSWESPSPPRRSSWPCLRLSTSTRRALNSRRKVACCSRMSRSWHWWSSTSFLSNDSTCRSHSAWHRTTSGPSRMGSTLPASSRSIGDGEPMSDDMCQLNEQEVWMRCRWA
mmetsp:Transcript_67703/g.211771  ORF Transcript_67703/g.211771 Transcript_67703/m.211771 type:complete len:259 (-) Transcript_67703:10-786(-)